MGSARSWATAATVPTRDDEGLKGGRAKGQRKEVKAKEIELME